METASSQGSLTPTTQFAAPSGNLVVLEIKDRLSVSSPGLQLYRISATVAVLSVALAVVWADAGWLFAVVIGQLFAVLV